MVRVERSASGLTTCEVGAGRAGVWGQGGRRVGGTIWARGREQSAMNTVAGARGELIVFTVF